MNTVLKEVFRELVAKCLSLLSLSPVGQTATPRDPLPRLYFLAGGPLELLPLHAAFWEDGPCKRYLADIADVGYFSSFRLLAEASERIAHLGLGQNLTILRATGRELPFIPWVAEFASQLFGVDARQFLVQSGPKAEEGKRLVLQDLEPSMLMITCHARANPTDGLRSGLFFSSPPDGQPDLSVADLLGIDLNHCTLTLLSACETSLKEVDDPPDECLSLANAFLAAGAAAAVGTQWAANDVASALWMAQFLLRNRINCSDPLRSACEASRWIKDSPVEEKLNLLESCKEALPNSYAEYLLHKDFSRPFLWANPKFYGASLLYDGSPRA